MSGRGRIWRRRLVAMGLLATALAAGYFFWLRDSSLFEVREVKVTGLTAANQAEVAAALQKAAAGMTTLNVDEAKLVSAVSPFPTVGAIEVDASPLHDLEVLVTERLPVAVAGEGDGGAPISADGYVLRGLRADPKLPPIELSERPKNGRVGEHDAEQAALLEALPAELRDAVEGSRYDPEQSGVAVDLRNGIELRLGDASRAEAKWAAAVAVLADPELGAPTYVDVSVPDRPVSGGFSG